MILTYPDGSIIVSNRRLKTRHGWISGVDVSTVVYDGEINTMVNMTNGINNMVNMTNSAILNKNHNQYYLKTTGTKQVDSTAGSNVATGLGKEIRQHIIFKIF